MTRGPFDHFLINPFHSTPYVKGAQFEVSIFHVSDTENYAFDTNIDHFRLFFLSHPLCRLDGTNLTGMDMTPFNSTTPKTVANIGHFDVVFIPSLPYQSIGNPLGIEMRLTLHP